MIEFTRREDALPSLPGFVSFFGLYLKKKVLPQVSIDFSCRVIFLPDVFFSFKCFLKVGSLVLSLSRLGSISSNLNLFLPGLRTFTVDFYRFLTSIQIYCRV